MIDALDHETLIKVAKQGFMSRGLQLKDLIASVMNNPDGPPHPHGELRTVPPFCVCGYCQEMPTDKERTCCKERRLYRSKSGIFQNICLDADNISTAVWSNAETYVFTPTYDNRAMRHSAYRQYVMWQHGHLGRGIERLSHRLVFGKYEKIPHHQMEDTQGIKINKNFNIETLITMMVNILSFKLNQCGWNRSYSQITRMTTNFIFFYVHYKIYLLIFTTLI